MTTSSTRGGAPAGAMLRRIWAGLLIALAGAIAAGIFALDRAVLEPGLHPEVLYGAGMLPLLVLGRRRPLLAYAALAFGLTWIDVAADVNLPDVASAALVGGLSSVLIGIGTALALRFGR